MRAASDSPGGERQKLARLRADVRALGSVLVAYSGGVDSTFLLHVAHDELGDRCVALTTLSPSTPARDRVDALDLARTIGVSHLVVETNELDVPGYAANPINRCFFCKSNLFEICERERTRLGLAVVVDGANVDDLGDHRPGLDAASRAGVHHPLVRAGFDKRDVRAASRALGLPTWDRPASPCLASRIPYGRVITADALARIDAAEECLRGLGFGELRVRASDDVARLEVAVDELHRLVEPSLRTRIVDALRALGFTHVTLDLAGFRSGSLNEGVVPRRQRTPAPSSRPRR